MSTTTEDILLPADSMTLYNLYYTPSMTNVTFHQGDKDSPIIYYALSKLIRTKPMFYVHEKSEKGPIVSFCQVPWVAGTMSIGLGDGLDSQWQKITRDRNLSERSDYQFQHDSIVYDWRKVETKKLATAYECLNDDGKICATLLSGGALNLQKGGELWIAKDLDQDLVHLLVAGALSIWTIKGLHYQSLRQAF